MEWVEWEGESEGTRCREEREQIVIQKGIKRRKCRGKKEETQLLGERMLFWCLRAAKAGNNKRGTLRGSSAYEVLELTVT